ncbi:MAG: CRISPR-associated endonuclease Cas2 [Desulfarculus sp.]|nr:CRISPR-associated endonuclease Cas2 [Desulfarculus sp.]
MPGVVMLTVFAYDVEENRDRRRIATMLQSLAVRVQKSVFEAWLPEEVAERLASKAAAMLGPNDSLRVYSISATGYRRTKAYGATALLGPQDYYLV